MLLARAQIGSRGTNLGLDQRIAFDLPLSRTNLPLLRGKLLEVIQQKRFRRLRFAHLRGYRGRHRSGFQRCQLFLCLFERCLRSRDLVLRQPQVIFKHEGL